MSENFDEKEILQMSEEEMNRAMIEDPMKRSKIFKWSRDKSREYAKGGRVPSEALDITRDDAERYVEFYGEVLDKAKDRTNQKFGFLGVMAAYHSFTALNLLESLAVQQAKLREELRQAIEAIRAENDTRLKELSDDLGKKPALSETERNALQLFQKFVKEGIEQDKRGQGAYG